MSRADFRGANGRSQRAARRRGYDHPELWGLTPPRSGKARSPCCWPARTRRSTWPSGMAAIALRWRRSCWFRWPEREGKFERGADKSSAQKVDHLTALSSRYFSELPTSVKAVLTFVPTAWTAATINTAIKLRSAHTRLPLRRLDCE
jgi:hypothetical protein